VEISFYDCIEEAVEALVLWPKKMHFFQPSKTWN